VTITRIATLDEMQVQIARSGSPTTRALRRLLRKKIAVICIAVIATFYIAGIFAPWLAPHGYADQNLDMSFTGPSWGHPFGTDRAGRDMLSRSMFSARTTVIVTLATITAGGFLLPLALGMLAGYVGGWIDALINRVGEVFSSLPGLPMLVLINATLAPRFDEFVDDTADLVGWGSLSKSAFPEYFIIFAVLSLFGWVGGARLVRTQVLTLRNSEFVIAALASGATTRRILFRHLFPNILPLLVVGWSAALGGIAGSEIALTFLGVGVQPPHPSFGALITDGASRTVLENHPQLLLVPAAIVASLIFAFNLLGDALNDAITPGTR
jgi:ABC-type dipeptide/oligopeptide/nickel transport system permease subunit